MAEIFIERTRLSSARRLKSRSKEPRFLPIDRGLLIFTTLMIIMGLIFTYSSSAFDSLYYFKRQLIFNFLGILIMFFLSQYFMSLQKYKVFKPLFILFASWGLLIWALCLPSVAHVHRWINFGFFNLQPSEIAKVALIVYLSSFLSKKTQLTRQSSDFMIPFMYAGITIVLIGLGRDIGTPVLLSIITLAIFFIAGATMKNILQMGLISLPFFILALFSQAYRLKRISDFLSSKESYQLMHSYYAIGSGGWFGKGLGASELKLEYLPAAHTDFIFSIICEEGGLLLSLFILGAFVWLLFKGLTVARRSTNLYRSYLISGITLCICLQAFINMCVATGAAPTKGLPLPFFSYGGSSVIVTLAMVGILMNLFALEKEDS